MKRITLIGSIVIALATGAGPSVAAAASPTNSVVSGSPNAPRHGSVEPEFGRGWGLPEFGRGWGLPRWGRGWGAAAESRSV